MKTEKLTSLEQQLEKLFEGYGRVDYEDVFNLGIQFGRELERLGINEYKAQHWINSERELELHQQLQEKVKKIEEFMAQLVRWSVKELIQEQGSWTITKRHYGFGEIDQFSDEIIKKFQIKILKVNMETYGGDFEITYQVVGELEENFKKYKIYNQFTSLVYNETGEEEQTIYDVKDVDKYIDRLTVHVRNSNDWELDQYDVFLNDISKPFLFELLQLKN